MECEISPFRIAGTVTTGVVALHNALHNGSSAEEQVGDEGRALPQRVAHP